MLKHSEHYYLIINDSLASGFCGLILFSLFNIMFTVVIKETGDFPGENFLELLRLNEDVSKVSTLTTLNRVSCITFILFSYC